MSEKQVQLEENAQTVMEAVKEGFIEPFRYMGFGVNTRWGKIRRWFFTSQLVVGLALAPAVLYDLVGLDTVNHSVEVVSIKESSFPGAKHLMNPVIELKILDGPLAGQIVERALPQALDYTPGQKLEMSYKIGRLLDTVVVKELTKR